MGRDAPGVDFMKPTETFLREQDDKLFLLLKLGKWQAAFGKKCTNLSFKFENIIIGQIEQQIFCALSTFSLGIKVW